MNNQPPSSLLLHKFNCVIRTTNFKNELRILFILRKRHQNTSQTISEVHFDVDRLQSLNYHPPNLCFTLTKPLILNKNKYIERERERAIKNSSKLQFQTTVTDCLMCSTNNVFQNTSKKGQQITLKITLLFFQFEDLSHITLHVNIIL